MLKDEFVFLADYKPFPFQITDIELDFVVEENKVKVESLMHIHTLNGKYSHMVLKGINLKLKKIEIDQEPLSPDSYELTSTELIIRRKFSENFRLLIVCEIDPFRNTSLEGLYHSEGMLTTQCEAEGFRKICFHPDRPDVLSRYRVRIEADKESYPVLLSNGNKTFSRDLPGIPSRHESVWVDPHPKPSYLFALVAASLSKVSDRFFTSKGREIQINLYVEPNDRKYTSHAISSLKKAMKWDEDVYGFEYDLDEFNIVAVRHFNMGAMENKGLNIFNSKLVLADNQIATDYEFERIESVIAHEYFHNWTGNRVTCRDWFQLSLKEGLTVFRDQCFTADMHTESVKRIEDVSFLRNTQFTEDSGPTSHAVKPIKYKSIDNFYTTTIYEKGAELIRMLYRILGRERFYRGIKIYIERFDGCAATTEDFLFSILEGACISGEELGFDIEDFNRWYYRAGTPKLDINFNWDSELGRLQLQIIQKCESEDINSQNKAYVIPFVFSLIGDSGPIQEEKMIILNQTKHEIIIENLPTNKEAPALSVFRGFSAPVQWDMPFPLENSFRILTSDDDPFSRWDASQRLFSEAILARASSKINYQFEERLVSVLSQLISNYQDEDLNLLSSLFTFPGSLELEDLQEVSDPLSIYKATYSLIDVLGQSLLSPLKEIIDFCLPGSHKSWPLGQGDRRMISLCWKWLVSSRDKTIISSVVEAVNGPSMTLIRAALEALKPIECVERENAFKLFYERWSDYPVILDSWFFLKSSSPSIRGLDLVREMLEHPKFDMNAPNAVRAVLGGLANNPIAFHAEDGSGYNFMAENLVTLDKRNPITASRLIKVFSRWKKYSLPRQKLICKAISRIESQDLSHNTREVLELIQT